MTRNLQRIGGKALVALMATMMLLSVFAGPAAAATNSVTESADLAVNADDFDGDDVDLTEESFVLEISTEYTANEGDQIIAQLGDTTAGNNVDEGDFDIDDASLDEAATTEDLDGADISVEAVNGNVFSTTTDTIEITFNEEVDVTSENADLAVEFNLTVSDTLSDQATKYSGDPILSVTTDEVGSDLAEASVATLDVHPGDPAELRLDDGTHQVEDISFDAGSTTVEVGAEDAEGNLIEEDAFDGNLEDFYDDNLNVQATLLNSSGGVVDTADDGATELGLAVSQTSPNLAEFDINDGGDENQDLNDLVVGDALTVEASASPDEGTFENVNADDEGIVIEPDNVEFTAAESGDVTADDGADGIELTHVLQDDGSTEIPDEDIDNVTMAFTGSADLAGVELSVGETVIVETAEDDGTVSVEDGEVTLTFVSTDNDVSTDVTSTVDEGSEFGSTAEITIIAGQPDALTFAEDSVEAVIEDTGGPTVTVQMQDAHDNVIDDRDFGETNVDVTLTGGEEIADRNTESFALAIDGEGGAGEATIEFTQDGSTEAGDEAIQIAAGNFSIEAEQTDPAPETEGVDVEGVSDVTFYPRLAVDDGATDANAGEEKLDDVTIQLQDDGDNSLNSDDNVDQIVVSSEFTDSAVQDGVDIDGDIFVDGAGTLDEVETVDVDVSYQLRSAGTHDIDFEAVPHVEDSQTEATATTTVDALAFNETESSISLENDFAGIVHDDENALTVTFELRDEFGNYPAYTDNPNLGDSTGVNFEIAGTSFEDSNNLIGSDFEITSVENANAEETLDIDTEATFDDGTTDVGDANASVLDAQGDVVEEDAIELTHEAFDLEEDFQRVSVPQPIATDDLLEENVDHITTWNTSDSNYDSEVIETTDDRLHYGLYVAGEDDDARLGYTFETDGTVNTGQQSLEDGWNLLGTNFDISNDENTPLDLQEDLLTVDDIEENPSGSEVVYDGGLSNILDASEGTSSTTADLSDAINVAEQGEYGTYWVYVEDTSELDSEVRQLVGPEYNSGDRDGAKSD